MSRKCFVNGSDDFMEALSSLDPKSRIKREIDKAIDDLKLNPTAGNRIEKKLWPAKYARKYQINNLFRYPLPDGWRLTYTIISDYKRVVSVILDALDHAAYDRLLGYHSS